jgi:hypothetical protein
MLIRSVLEREAEEVQKAKTRLAGQQLAEKDRLEKEKLGEGRRRDNELKRVTQRSLDDIAAQ